MTLLTDMPLTNIIAEQLDFVREHETANAIVLGLKLSEEVGEFAEATLVENGYLKHKTLKEDSFAEAADIINVLLGVLVKLHPYMKTEDIIDKLAYEMQRKLKKYAKILEQSAGGNGDPVDTFGGSDF